MLSQADQRPGAAVIMGAISTWRDDGENTRLITCGVPDTDVPPESCWGISGTLVQTFVAKGFCRPDQLTQPTTTATLVRDQDDA